MADVGVEADDAVWNGGYCTCNGFRLRTGQYESRRKGIRRRMEGDIRYNMVGRT